MRVANPLPLGTDHPGRYTTPRATLVSEVRVELGCLHSANAIRAEIEADPVHWLAQFKPRVRTTDQGRTEIRLTMIGTDAWNSVLTTMAALRQSGYDLHALHVESQELEQQPDGA